MTRYAIILATEEYVHFSPTPFCHADATLLERTLVDECDYAAQHVLTKLLSRNDTVLPMDTLDEIENLVKGAARGDTILFFYAGHGHLQGGDTFLLLPHTEPGRWEQTSLPLRDISDRLRASERVNVRIFDACHSGVDVRDGSGTLDPRGFSRAVLEEAQQGWITLAACSEEESSYPDPTANNGIFTRALCDSLLESPAGPVYPETLKVRLAEKVRRRTAQLSCRQTPVLNAFVRGNVSIADRRVAPVTSGTTPPKPAELLSRIASLRGFPSLGGKEHKARLQEYVVALHAHLEQSKDSLSLGISAIASKPTPINGVPFEFKKRLVQEVSGMGLPNHEINEASEEIMERADGYMAILHSFQPAKGTGRYETVYRVSQSKEWPDSWCTLELQGDGYVPSFLAGFYLIPFQFKALLVCIVASRGKQRSAETRWEVERVTKDVVMLDKQPADVIETLATPGLTAFSEVCAVETANRLSRLERELLAKA
jgi:hypothetical protein